MQILKVLAQRNMLISNVSSGMNPFMKYSSPLKIMPKQDINSHVVMKYAG